LLLANTVVAEARPFPDLTVEIIELAIEQSVELPTKEAVRYNQVWCGSLVDFDELIICVERTERIEHFSDKARSQIQGITTVAEYKQLNDAIRDTQSDARAAERYLRVAQVYRHGAPLEHRIKGGLDFALAVYIEDDELLPNGLSSGQQIFSLRLAALPIFTDNDTKPHAGTTVAILAALAQ
jgi:hypothetical protein